MFDSAINRLIFRGMCLAKGLQQDGSAQFGRAQRNRALREVPSRKFHVANSKE